MRRSISTAEMTPWLSSPGMPVFLSVWAPMEMYRQSYCFFSSLNVTSLPTETSVWTWIPSGEDGCDLLVQQLPGQTVAGNAVAQHTAQLLPLLVDRDLVAHQGQIVGGG